MYVCRYSTLAEVLCYVLCLLRSAVLFRAVPYDAMPMPWPETICRLAYSGMLDLRAVWMRVCEFVSVGVCVCDCAPRYHGRKGRGQRRQRERSMRRGAGRAAVSRVPIHRLISCLRANPLLCRVMGRAKVEKYIDVDGVVVVGEVDVRSRC